MKIEDVLKEVIEILEECKIEYMITGSFASNLYGIPRSTLDVDIIILVNFDRLEKFINRLTKDFYADINMAKEALQRESTFNIIHYETGFKIDLIIRKSDPYHITEFERRGRYKLADKECFFASAEDTILSKLLWAKMGESERQFKDALSVMKIQKLNLDYEYLRRWAESLNIGSYLERLIKESKEL